jgi:hypothetical protein
MAEENNKVAPLVMTGIHSLVSMLGSIFAPSSWLIAGLEVHTVVAAILGAAVGSILGFMPLSNKTSWLIVALTAVIAIPALLGYSSLLSQPGATFYTLAGALLLLFYVFGALFFLFANIERRISQNLTFA